MSGKVLATHRLGFACSQNMDALDMFTHSPLFTRGSIRVVELLPGAFNDAIECEISSAELESEPAYEALSYTWGDPNDTNVIVINGRRFDITVNLECALRHLRRLDAKRPLWIDAICINQQDEREKETQVRAMAAIYKQSTKVLIWLGPELDPSIFNGGGPSPMPISEVFEVISNVAAEKSITHLVGEMPWEAWDRWTPSLLGLFKRAWFSRLWIVQETTMTPNPTLICGEWSLPWSSLYKAHNRLPATLSFTANGAVAMRGAFQNIDAVVNCWRLHQSWKDSKTLPEGELARRLILLLYSLQGCFLCSDARDRIYGILGMVGDPEVTRHVTVDYQASAATVFRDFAVFVMGARRSLDILTGDRASFSASEYPGKPSWVPTWSSYTTYTRRLYPLPYIWTAGSQQNAIREQPRADYRLSEDRNILYAKGAIIGTVVTIGTPPPYYPDTSRTGALGEEHRKALSQLLIMWETEVVHLPLLRARCGEAAFQKALGEMGELWGRGIVHLPSLRESYATEPDIDAFRTALFPWEEPGSRSERVSQQQCYEILLGRGDPDVQDDPAVTDEVYHFSSFKWRDLNDMAPFRLSGGQFGIFESDGIYQAEPPYQIKPIIALFAGGSGPVALCKEGEGHYRFMGPCHVQGLEDESQWEDFLEGKELEEFTLI